MLQITRNVGQAFSIKDIAHIKVVAVDGGLVKIELAQQVNSVIQLIPGVFLHLLSARRRQVRFGIDAPQEVLVLRDELETGR